MTLKSIIPIAATCLVLFLGSCTKDTTSTDSTLNTSTDLLDANSVVSDTLKSLHVRSGSTSDKLTNPLNNATGVPLDQIITVAFNDNLTTDQISKSTFTLKAMISGTTTGTIVAGTVSFNNKTAIFTPNAKLNPNTVYEAIITSMYFDRTRYGRPKIGYSWHFTTGAAVSTPLPTVTSSLPINAATAVVLNQPVSVNFSEAMDPLTINDTTFTVKQGTLTVAGKVSYSGTAAIFTPTTDFAPNTVYTVAVSTGAKDVAGIAMLSNYTFTFTTAAALDVIPPTIQSVDPLNGTTGVALSKVIAINFSESMTASTISATNITLKLGTTAVTGAVALSGTKATFTPSAVLAANSVYTCTVSTGVKDLAGNALATNYTFSFTTGAAPDLTPPTVSSVDPLNNATGVAINKVLTVTFSEAMDNATISGSTITLKQGSTNVAGTVAYSASKATFTPSANLANGVVYTATVTTGVHDAAGNPMASNYTFSFTTVAAIVTPPTPIITSGSDYRNFYGISWRGTAHENLQYAKQMGYTSVFYQYGMESDPLSSGLKFIFESPECYTYYANVSGGSMYINSSNSYAQSQQDWFENNVALKNNTQSFPNNIANGFTTGSTFATVLDFQQQKVIDNAIQFIINEIHRIEGVNPNFKFGGLAWDVPNPSGDFWGGGNQVGLSYWTGGDYGAIHAGCTHEYATFTDGHMAYYKKLYTTLRQSWPAAKFIGEPYDIYRDWISQIQNRADASQVQMDLISEEGPGTTFVDDSRIFASGLITKDRVLSTTPNVYADLDNRTIAAKAAINGATFGWFGRFGGTGNMPDYSSITAVPGRLKLIRVLPNWENINQTALTQRSWDGTTYKSPTAFADPNAIGVLQPNTKKYFVVFMSTTGQITLPAGRSVVSISKTNSLNVESGDGSADISVQNGVVKLNGTAGLNNTYILLLN